MIHIPALVLAVLAAAIASTSKERPPLSLVWFILILWALATLVDCTVMRVLDEL